MSIIVSESGECSSRIGKRTRRKPCGKRGAGLAPLTPGDLGGEPPEEKSSLVLWKGETGMGRMGVVGDFILERNWPDARMERKAKRR